MKLILVILIVSNFPSSLGYFGARPVQRYYGPTQEEDSTETEPGAIASDDWHDQPFIGTSDKLEYYLGGGVKSRRITEEKMEKELQTLSSRRLQGRLYQLEIDNSQISYQFFPSAWGGNYGNYRRLPADHNKFNKNQMVKLLIHGFSTSTNTKSWNRIWDQHMYRFVNKYREHYPSYNPIVVDWTSYATQDPKFYLLAAAYTRPVADDVAQFLIDMVKKGLIASMKYVHIIGFSLGAHLAARVGEIVEWYGHGKLGRITGIDPAGPGFAYSLIHSVPGLPNDFGVGIFGSYHLDKRHADFVDIIHCNEGRLALGQFGSSLRKGHVDIIVNYGTHQPTCKKIMNYKGCSHLECPKYYVDSIHFRDKACQKTSCSKWNIFCKEKFTNKCTIFGENCQTSSRGTYYFEMWLYW